MVVGLQTDADLLIGGQGRHPLLRDLRGDAGAHRPPPLPNRKPQLLLHRHRRDQLDRHRHVVPPPHHPHPPPPPPDPPHPPPPPLPLLPLPPARTRAPTHPPPCSHTPSPLASLH